MSTTTTERDLRYLRVPGTWEDTRETRPALIREVVRLFGDGWQVEAIGAPRDDGTRAVVLARTGDVNPNAARKVEHLIPGVSPAKAATFDARYRAGGSTLVHWDPADRIAVAAALPATTRDLRDRVAKALGVEPWSLDLVVDWGLDGDGLGQVQCMTVGRAPVLGTSEKRREVWAEVARSMVPLADDETWWVEQDAFAGTVTLTRRVDPLRAILLADDLDLHLDGVPIVTIGRSERGEMLTLDLAKQATHIAVQGQTRSGKSIFTYQLLSQLAASPSVIICGADPSGVTLAPFKGTRHGAHQALGTLRPEAVLEVLGYVVQEMDARTARLAEELVDKLDLFTPQRPLIVVVLEEYPGLRRAIEAADAANGPGSGSKLLPLVDLAISRLLAEGAKIGVRVLLIAQRLDTTVLKGGDRANIPTRISFRVDKSEAVGMLHESLPPGLDVEQVRNFSPGVGLYESSVAGQPLTRFRAPLLEGGYGEFVRRVREGSPVIDSPTAEAQAVIDLDVVELGEAEFSLDEWEAAAGEALGDSGAAADAPADDADWDWGAK